MTEGRISKKLILFTLPIIGGLVLQMLYSTVDGIIVGNFVCQEALGAVNTSGNFVNLLIAAANGIAGGSSVFIAQLFGAKEKERLHKAISTMIILMVVIGVVLTAVGELLTDIVLRNLLNIPEEAYAWAHSYLRIYLLGLIFVFLYNALASALRAIGDSKAAMFMLVVASVTNIALDLLFVIVFHWNVEGVGIATVIAQCTAVVMCFIYIKKKQPLLHISRSEFVFNRSDCALYFRTGVPLALQQMIGNVGMLLVQRLVNSYGPAFMASTAAASKIEAYAVIPIMSFAQAMIVFSGQNIGAGKPERVPKGLHRAWGMSFCGCVMLSTVFYLFAPSLIGFFGCTGKAIDIGSEYLYFVPVTLFFAMFFYTTRCVLQGAGDIKVPVILTFVTLTIRVISAYVMAATPIGYRAVWICSGVDYCVGAIMILLRFRTGKWKTASLIKEAD